VKHYVSQLNRGVGLEEWPTVSLNFKMRRRDLHIVDRASDIIFAESACLHRVQVADA
jgi:hypothetical protein